METIDELFSFFNLSRQVGVLFFSWAEKNMYRWKKSGNEITKQFFLLSRCLAEHEKVRSALGALEPIASRSWSIERKRIYQLQEHLTLQDVDTYPICSEIDVESYALCAAASARKYCVNEGSVKIVKNFKRLFIALFVISTLCYFFK